MKGLLVLLVLLVLNSPAQDVAERLLIKKHKAGAAAGGSTRTFTNVQRVVNAACTITSASCTVTVASTGLHNLIGVGVTYVSNAAQTISSCTGGGTYTVASGGTSGWEGATNGTGVAGCFTADSTSGTTAVVVNLGAAPGQQWSVMVWEFSYTGTVPCVQDDSPARVKLVATAVDPVPGITSVLTGTSVQRLQWISTTATIATSVSTFTNLFEGGAGSGISTAQLNNTSANTAPDWTFGATQTAAIGEMAFK